jgi:F-type H+-transporting ATPase subunit gamma
LATLRDLKRQIGSVKNIAKVTEALQTVSAVKFRKAEARVKKARPYADNVEQMMRDVARSASGDSPLLAGREVPPRRRRLHDRGPRARRRLQRAGLRRTAQFRAEKGQEADLGQVASGRKSVAFFRFRNIELDHVYTGYTDSPTYEQAREIGRALTGLFEDEKADEVYLIYNRFESALTQRPVLKRLIPVAAEEEGENGEDEERNDNLAYMEYVPDPETVLQAPGPALRGDDGVAGAA